MDLMTEAIAEFRRHSSLYIWGTILMSLPSLGVGAYIGWLWFDTEMGTPQWLQWGGIWIAVFVLFFNQFLYGACRCAQIALHGGHPRLRLFFSPAPLGHVLVVTVLTALGLLLGLAACLLGGLVVATLVFLALPAVCAGDRTSIGALKWSWRTLTQDFRTAFAICNSVHLTAVAGIAILGIGIFITLPFYPIAQAVLYHRLRNEPGAEPGTISSVPQGSPS